MKLIIKLIDDNGKISEFIYTKYDIRYYFLVTKNNGWFYELIYNFNRVFSGDFNNEQVEFYNKVIANIDNVYKEAKRYINNITEYGKKKAIERGVKWHWKDI